MNEDKLDNRHKLCYTDNWPLTLYYISWMRQWQLLHIGYTIMLFHTIFNSQQLGRYRIFPTMCVQLRITKRQNNSGSFTTSTISCLLEDLEWETCKLSNFCTGYTHHCKVNHSPEDRSTTNSQMSTKRGMLNSYRLLFTCTFLIRTHKNAVYLTLTVVYMVIL